MYVFMKIQTFRVYNSVPNKIIGSLQRQLHARSFPFRVPIQYLYLGPQFDGMSNLCRFFILFLHAMYSKLVNIKFSAPHIKCIFFLFSAISCKLSLLGQMTFGLVSFLKILIVQKMLYTYTKLQPGQNHWRCLSRNSKKYSMAQYWCPCEIT